MNGMQPKKSSTRVGPGMQEPRAFRNYVYWKCTRCMNIPLSRNELIILDRQMAMISRQLGEIASLLESRLGETAEMAQSARIIEQGFSDLARKAHNQAAASEETPLASRRQTA